MEIGDTFSYGKNNYKIIDIVKSDHAEHDILVCTEKAGYKECFQRFDLEGSEVIPRERKHYDVNPFNNLLNAEGVIL